MARRVWFKEGVFAEFADNCGSDDADDDRIKQELENLGKDPARGFKIPFTDTLFYQIPIPPYVAHYVFDDHDVTILYLGILGKC